MESFLDVLQHVGILCWNSRFSSWDSMAEEDVASSSSPQKWNPGKQLEPVLSFVLVSIQLVSYQENWLK